ncbi:MAG: RNA polymerase sigma factor [Sphingobacteriales bacterium]|nr:MAG: RNA polymerase sigma factor [Sphingobacteriales bacterium]
MTRQTIWADYKKLSDEELVHRYAHKHEQAAVNCLFERYGHMVYGVCLKYLKHTGAAKDATQQIFVKLLEDLVRFKIDSFKPWLYQTTKNHCLMQSNKSIPVSNNRFEGVADKTESDSDVQVKLQEVQAVEQLEKELAVLSEEQRSCIDMFYLQQHTYATIATKKGITIEKVKSAIQDGRRHIKLKLLASGKGRV